MILTRFGHAIERWIAGKVLDWCWRRVGYRRPDLTVGPLSDPSLLRWWLWPHPKDDKRACLFFHQMLRDDDDRATHDHPWWSLSLILTEGLGEWHQSVPPHSALHWRAFRPGQLVLRRATSAHRLTVDPYKPYPCTLFLVGPVVRDWGFWCPQGWRDRRIFAEKYEGGNQRGQGCA